MVTDTGPRLRIVFFGTPEFAVPSLHALVASRHAVAGVVTRPDRPSGRGHHLQPPAVKRAALALGLTVLQPERLTDDVFLGAINALGADLGVIAAYGKILGESLLQVPRLGFINVHASLLPKHRGAAPVHRAVMAGDTMTGATIMRVVRALDAGPILASTPRPIGPEETSEEVERDVAALGARLLAGVIDDLALGRAREVPQDDSQATYAPRVEKAEGQVDWRRSARAIHDQVRGLHPWPHAYTHVGATRYILLRTRVEPPGVQRAQAPVASPGQVVEASGDVLAVATGDGVLVIREIQPEGRRPCTAREFLAGHPIAAGSVFGQRDNPS